MKDNEERKKGFGSFFKKENKKKSDNDSKKESLFNSEIGDTERITNFFSQDNMNTSQQDDLSELIKKLQIQKNGLDILDLKKEKNKKSDELSKDRKEDDIGNAGSENIIPGDITAENKIIGNSFVKEENSSDTLEIVSQNAINENPKESYQEKTSSELEKILGKLKDQEPQPKLSNKQNNEFLSEEKPQITDFEPLSKPEQKDILDIDNEIFKDLAEDDSKLDEITKDLSEETVPETAEETDREITYVKNDIIEKKYDLLSEQKETIIKKPVSELETILGKIKKAESAEIRETSENINEESETSGKKVLEKTLPEKEELSTPLEEQINKITMGKEDEIEYRTNIKEDDSKKEEIKESAVSDNLSDGDEIQKINSEAEEKNAPPKKYTVNRTKWSQSEPEENNKINQKEDENIKNRTISSAIKTKWSQSEPEEDNKINQKEDENIKNRTISSAKKTRWSETDSEIYEQNPGLISAENIESGYSGLIMPRGATFEIEEFTLKSIQKEIEPGEDDETISKINKIYSEYFPPIDFEKINEIDLSDAKKKKKSKLSDLFKESKRDKYEYNPSIHGPVVDLSFKKVEGVEEVELYPVNEPYAYVRIVYDKNSNEYIYNVLEPVLSNAENKLLSEIEQRLFETLDVNTKDLTKENAKEILKDSVNDIIGDYGLKLDPVAKEKILYQINKEFLGEGLIDPIMHDKFIEDISCDGLNTPLFVFHSNYESLQTNLFYNDNKVLDSFVTKLAQRAGKYISIAEPMLDATMSDGSRIQMTLGTEVTAHGSTFTIRKFKDEPITPTDLTEWGTFSPLSIAYIWLAVEAGKSCIFAGGTASGKTTSLNAISLFIPPLAKIVTLEDTRELKLPHQNWIPSITRESFDKDGKGSIDMYELLRAALRQRPEYILVGEVRGAEAQTLFQAMSTGHVTYATMHADSVASAVHRIENPPLNVPRNMLSSLDLMSVQVQVRIGGQRTRRNKQLIEILDIDPRTRELITNEVFKWNQATDEIRYSGKSYILEDIMESRGWDEARMVEELKRRQEILEWMRLKKLRNYKDVGKVLMSYFRDPEAVIKLVRDGLYE